MVSISWFCRILSMVLCRRLLELTCHFCLLGTRRVHCNVIYNEYIQNKEHIHMNATRVFYFTVFA